jgi:hypothetical protein
LNGVGLATVLGTDLRYAGWRIWPNLLMHYQHTIITSLHDNGVELPENNHTQPTRPVVTIYVSQHCELCGYTHEVAALIRERFPQVDVRLVDLETTSEEIPEEVFATPTYLLNGRVWSLGNPSLQKVQDSLEELLQA